MSYLLPWKAYTVDMSVYIEWQKGQSDGGERATCENVKVKISHVEKLRNLTKAYKELDYTKTNWQSGVVCMWNIIYYVGGGGVLVRASGDSVMWSHCCKEDWSLW